jgi:hypothetical protein
VNNNCIPGDLTLNTLYVTNLIAINSTQQTIISANATTLVVVQLDAENINLSGVLQCVIGPNATQGYIDPQCVDISGKTCTSPVDATCLPLRIGTINGIAPNSLTSDFTITSGGAGLVITPTTNGIIVSNTGVTSVGLAVPTAEFTATVTPVTSTGTLTFVKNVQTANHFWAGPVTGAAGECSILPR